MNAGTKASQLIKEAVTHSWKRNRAMFERTSGSLHAAEHVYECRDDSMMISRSIGVIHRWKRNGDGFESKSGSLHAEEHVYEYMDDSMKRP